tara:strand:+ start:14978 stop:16864 length:1887 start_codon:yes stop_codon:yes gene_type:complete
MSIFLKSERKNSKVILLLISIYAFLTLGALTMIYPLLLMLSGSVKGKLDAYEFDVVPKFLLDDKTLFKRYVEHKYNEKTEEYQVANKEFIRIFKAIVPPDQIDNAKIEDWINFQKSSIIPAEFYHVGNMYYLPGEGNRVTTRNTRGFRNHIRDLCSNSPENFRKYFDTQLPDWYFLDLSPERLLDRNYKIPRTKFADEFYKFKQKIPIHDRVYLSIGGDFSRYLKSLNDYNGNISNFNSKNKTDYESFFKIPFSSTIPSGILASHWENYVRHELNPQFILLSAKGFQNFTIYLKEKFIEIDDLNLEWRTDYNSFEEIDFIGLTAYESNISINFVNFIKSNNSCPIDEIIIKSTETLWRDYLKSKYYNINTYNEKYNLQYISFANVPMPVKDADFKFVIENKNQLRWEYLTHNYRMVIEYLTLFGDGLKNTIIYCFFSIMTALIINPLAAYALSRYQLSNQYKILLFFIATMTFPPMVTMIPNYLLMKDIGFLNTFFALIIPGMANGYSIFLLKGFFDSLPKELYEAADIDAASEYHKFWHIAMSLSKPILAVIALGAFNGAYSNFMFAVILCPDEKMWTMMVWLVQMQALSSRGAVMASLVLSALPTLIVFIFAQNIILRGIVLPVEK